MTKKILLLVFCFSIFSFANAQLNSVAIVGGATPNGWPTNAPNEVDTHQMTTTDGVNWTILNIILKNNAVKFRGNNSWALPYNWGGTSFPNGTAIIDGSGITTVAGVYNVTFNSSTLVYKFDRIAEQVISIIGGATPGEWVTDTDMTTLDGTIYTLNNVSLIPGPLKFRGDHSWDLPNNWGGTAFPSGTAVVDANGITIPTAGNYTITFNKTSLAYTFTTTLGVKDFNAVNFKVYPNPTQGNWVFNSSEKNIESIVIVDITGKIVKTTAPKSNQTSIDASGLTPGIYFANITTATGTQILKLIKQ